MVRFSDLSNLSDTAGIGGILSIPNSTYPYFWIWIFGGIWLIISLTLYFKEKERLGRGNLISSMAVSSLAILALSLLGTIVGFIMVDIMIIILVFCFLIIGVWFFINRE